MSESHRAVKKRFAGIYVLIIQVSEDIEVEVGALGRIAFTKGVYAYVGSAQTNLKQRIERHLRKEKRRFWHVDYLLNNNAARIVKVFFEEADRAEECRTAKIIGERNRPVTGFGCSDCRCKSHLFQIKNYRYIQKKMQAFPTENEAF